LQTVRHLSQDERRTFFSKRAQARKNHQLDAKNVVAPEGCVVVKDGIIINNDRVWNDSDYRWEIAIEKMVGDDVDAYYCVARQA
jgi:hypothetical protein